MSNFYKITSFAYLFVLTFSLLIPLDSTVVLVLVDENSHPTDFIALFIHLILYFILYFLFEKIILYKKILFFVCIIYSIIIEFLQLLSGRGFEFLDILFNIIGIILAYIMISLYNLKFTND